MSILTNYFSHPKIFYLIQNFKQLQLHPDILRRMILKVIVNLMMMLEVVLEDMDAQMLFLITLEHQVDF